MRRTRPPLTPPADLVGRWVTWTPRDTRGHRTTRQTARVLAWNPDTRLLTVEQSKPVSPWSPEPTRTAVVPLHHGPFTPVS